MPYRLLPKYHKRLLTNACLQTRLVRELEKKFSGRIVVIIAQRRILRKPLKKDGLLTSDSRIKERKKYGLAGARKRFQFSKR